VPILCYHRFGARPGRLVVTAAAFEAQMAYLEKNDYHVISLRDLLGFLEGKAALPPRAIVISIDDGYASTFEVAFPVLKRYGFPAVVFLYSDFATAPDGLSWAQMKDMTASGLVEIQPHSRTHSNMALRLPGEDETQYRARLGQEVAVPAKAIRERLGSDIFSFAYPYGDVTPVVTAQLARSDIPLDSPSPRAATRFSPRP